MKFNKLISAEEIGRAVITLAYTLDRLYEKQQTPLQIIPVMDGAMIFAADLIRWMTIPVIVTPITCKSYEGTQPGELRASTFPNITGSPVLFVEDILDTGVTLRKLRDEALNLGAASSRACVLLDKGKESAADLRHGFVCNELTGFKIYPDRFVIGYGLDLDGLYRNLSYIAEVTSDTLPL